MSERKVNLVSIPGLGKAYFRPLSKFQPDNICRTCGRKTDKEVTTEEPLSYGRISIPCCETQDCYDGSSQRTVIGQIKSMSGQQ